MSLERWTDVQQKKAPVPEAVGGEGTETPPQASETDKGNADAQHENAPLPDA